MLTCSKIVGRSSTTVSSFCCLDMSSTLLSEIGTKEMQMSTGKINEINPKHMYLCIMAYAMACYLLITNVITNIQYKYT